MKTWIPCAVVMFTSVARCLGGDVESLSKIIKLEHDESKGTFVSTNATSIPFYLFTEDPNLSSMVGRQRNAFVLSRTAGITQYVPTMKRESGKLRSTGYIRTSGRYAVLSGRSLTLTDFYINVSDEDDEDASRGEVTAVQSKSITFQVSPAFEAEAQKLMRKR